MMYKMWLYITIAGYTVLYSAHELHLVHMWNIVSKTTLKQSKVEPSWHFMAPSQTCSKSQQNITSQTKNECARLYDLYSLRALSVGQKAQSAFIHSIAQPSCTFRIHQYHVLKYCQRAKSMEAFLQPKLLFLPPAL